MIVLSAIMYHEADMCYGLCGKKEPSTTTVQREEVNLCLMQYGSTFQRTCLLHHLSKLLKCSLVAEICRVIRLKLNRIQSALVTLTHILEAGVKS